MFKKGRDTLTEAFNLKGSVMTIDNQQPSVLSSLQEHGLAYLEK